MRAALLDLLEAAPGPFEWWTPAYDAGVVLIVAGVLLLVALARGWRP